MHPEAPHASDGDIAFVRDLYRRLIERVESDFERLAGLDAEFDAITADRSARAEAFLLRYIEYVPQDFADLTA